MAIPISNVTRRVVYAASGTGPYAFTFEILANTDIAVYRDDTLLTLTTDYTVTINANGTGSVTLTASPTGATQIAIVGNRTIQRATDFTTGGDFFANTLNDELDQQTIFNQQNAEGLQRALSAPQTDPTSINMTLPRASLRANKALGFDASGNPVIADTLGTNRGNWAASTLYYVRDIVKDTTNNNIWQCIVQHTSTGSQPINTNTDSAKWTLLVDAASASTSASNAANSASAAATSASNAAASASNAATSASNASTSASNASTSASNASSSASAAASSASFVSGLYDSFDDRYLGAKSSDPSLDNDGNSLIDGALYFDTTNNVMKVYDQGGTVWKRTTPTTTDQANIDITAANIANINQNAANIVAIQNASTNATNAANSATAAAASATAAAASAASASAVVLGNEPVRPSVRPSLLLDFANTKELDPRITFTRASTATYYDGKTVAKAEENLLTYSQEFDNAAWTKSNTAISGTNTIVAPDGTTTAEEMRDGTATAGHSVFQAYTVAAGTTYVFSCFLKNVDRQFATLAVSTGSGTWAAAKFDLSAGTAGSTSAAGSGWSTTSSSITSVGSGWYRCVLVFVAGNSASANARIGAATDGTTFTGGGSGLESYTGTDLKIAMWGAQLEQRSSVTAYTATTTAPITNYIPRLLTAAAGVARFDHNPTTGESLGLEIEEQRTNLFTYSEQLENAAWNKNAVSTTVNAAIAPDGTQTADLIIPSTASAEHTYGQTISFTSGTTYTISCYFKAAGYTTIRMRIATAAFGSTSGVFDLSSGVASVTTGTPSVSMTLVGNGWYRCVMTATATATASGPATVALAAIGGSTTAAGDGYAGYLIWGAQLEAGAFATSYIQTVAAQVTRSADSASMTGTNFSSWFNQSEGTFYAQFVPAVSDYGSNKNIFMATDNTSANFIGLRYGSNGSQPVFAATASSAVQANIASGVMTAGTAYKFVGAYKVNDFASSRNAGTVGTDTAGTIPIVDRAEIGALAGANITSQTIAKLAYYPKRIADAELQGVTTV